MKPSPNSTRGTIIATAPILTQATGYPAVDMILGKSKDHGALVRDLPLALLVIHPLSEHSIAHNTFALVLDQYCCSCCTGWRPNQSFYVHLASFHTFLRPSPARPDSCGKSASPIGKRMPLPSQRWLKAQRLLLLLVTSKVEPRLTRLTIQKGPILTDES